MRITFVFALFFFAGTLSAQEMKTSKIKGTVSNADAKALTGAVVKIRSSDNTIKQEVQVDADGKFTFNNLPFNHRYICTAYHDDYQDVTLKNFHFEDGKALKIDFKLYKDKNDQMGVETFAFLTE